MSDYRSREQTTKIPSRQYAEPEKQFSEQMRSIFLSKVVEICRNHENLIESTDISTKKKHSYIYIYITFARLFRELKKKKVFDNRPESLQAVGKPIEEHKKCG